MCSRAEPGPSPLRGGGDAAAPRGLLELGGPFPSWPWFPPSPAGGPRRPTAWGWRSLATVRAGGSHQRGDGGDFGAILLPGLQILQSEERRVVQTERVRLDGVVEALLEGVVLQLQHEPARLLPLRLPLLRRLPPAPGEGEGQHCHAPGTAGPPAGLQPSREPRPAGSLEAQSPSASGPAPCARGRRVPGAGRVSCFCCARGGCWQGTPPAAHLHARVLWLRQQQRLFLLRDNKGRRTCN